MSTANQERENIKLANEEVRKYEGNKDNSGCCGKNAAKNTAAYEKAANNVEQIIKQENEALRKANSTLLAHKESVDRWTELKIRSYALKSGSRETSPMPINSKEIWAEAGGLTPLEEGNQQLPEPSEAENDELFPLDQLQDQEPVNQSEEISENPEAEDTDKVNE